MRSKASLLRLAGRIALCATALALGVAAARYTDIARYDRTRAQPPSDATNDGSASYDRLRASVRYTGNPSTDARASRLLRAP